nr:ribonuclease H-like domain-containing protein [Tanacetum cinerariifolium]
MADLKKPLKILCHEIEKTISLAREVADNVFIAAVSTSLLLLASVTAVKQIVIGEYDIWAMKMQNFISSSELSCWNIILKGNNAKSMTTDNDGNLKIRPPITAEEHQQVQREEKARTILLFAFLDEHIGDFYHMIDARDIWNAIKARFEEGLDKGYDKMQKILSQMNTLKIKPEPEDVNMKFLRGLPPFWSGIALILKTKGGLEYILFDDLNNKLKFLEIDTKGYSSSSSTLSNAAFGSSKSKCSVVDDVIYSFFANHEIDQQLVYEDLDQMNKDEFGEYDLKHQMAMLSIKVHRFEKKHGRKIKFNGRENARFDKKLVKCINCKKMGHFSRECRAQGVQNRNNYQKYKSKEARKDGSDSKAMVVVDGSIDWDKQTEDGNTDPRSLESFGMLAGIKLESDADSEGEVVSADDVIPAAVSNSAGPVAAAAVSLQSETEIALMGLSTEVSIPITCPLCCDSKYKLIEKDYHEQREQLNDCVVYLKAHKHAVKSLEKQIKCHQTNQLAYEEKIRVLSYELEEKSNILEYRQKLIDQATQDKYDLMTKLDNELANQAKWNNSGKNLYKLIDSSMSVRTKLGLGLDKYIGEGELGIDDSVFSIFYTTSNDFKGQPIYNSDRSSKPSTNDFQTCDSSQECSRPNRSDHDSNDFISSVSAPASASSDIIVIDCARQEDFPSVCPSSIKTDVKSSKTLCNKFSYLHLIKDCDFHEQTFTKINAEGKGKLGKRPTGKPVKTNRPNPVSAGQQNTISAGLRNPVYAGQPNPVSAGNGILGPRPLNIQSTSTYFHSFTHNNQQIIFPITHNSLYLLYKTGGLNGKTVVKPSAGWPWTKSMSTTNGSKINGVSKSKSWSFAKGPLGNKDKLEDFEHFDGGEVTFGGSTCKISGKGAIKTKTLNFKNVLYVEELQAVRYLKIRLTDKRWEVLGVT